MNLKLTSALVATFASSNNAFIPLSSHGYKDIKPSSTVRRHSRKAFLHRMSDEDIFEAEETAAFDAHDVSDSGVEAAVMERAVMMAYDMMKKKKLELREKVQDARAAEQQYVMMEQATEDLVKQYNQDPTQFKKDHSNLSGAQVAIEMLETVIADAAQKMIDIESEKDLVISQFYDVLEEEHIAEARAAKETLKEEASSARVYFIEEFDDAYEIQERQRDFAVAHAAQQAAEDEVQRIQDASSEEEELLEKEQKLERQLAEHRRNEEILKADLREVQEIVRDELLKEWESQQRVQQEQRGLM